MTAQRDEPAGAGDTGQGRPRRAGPWLPGGWRGLAILGATVAAVSLAVRAVLALAGQVPVDGAAVAGTLLLSYVVTGAAWWRGVFRASPAMPGATLGRRASRRWPGVLAGAVLWWGLAVVAVVVAFLGQAGFRVGAGGEPGDALGLVVALGVFPIALAAVALLLGWLLAGRPGR